MRMLIALLICCTLASCTFGGSGPESLVPSDGPLNLWGKVDYGMSVAEVRNAYPSTIKPAEPQEGGGTVGLLMLENVEIDHTKFNAEFSFQQHTQKLEWVTLIPQDHRNLTAEQADKLFDRLQVLLSEKYGRTTSKSHTTDLVGSTDRWVWIDKSREISLTKMYVPMSESLKKTGINDYFGIGVAFLRVDLSRTENL